MHPPYPKTDRHQAEARFDAVALLPVLARSSHSVTAAALYRGGLEVPSVPTALPAIHGLLAATARGLILVTRNLADLGRRDARVVTLSIRGSLGPFHGDVTYQLAPAGSGTALTNTVNLQPSGPLRLLAPLAASRVKSAVATNLDALKQILETGGQPTDR